MKCFEPHDNTFVKLQKWWLVLAANWFLGILTNPTVVIQ